MHPWGWGLHRVVTVLIAEHLKGISGEQVQVPGQSSNVQTSGAAKERRSCCHCDDALVRANFHVRLTVLLEVRCGLV